MPTAFSTNTKDAQEALAYVRTYLQDTPLKNNRPDLVLSELGKIGFMGEGTRKYEWTRFSKIAKEDVSAKNDNTHGVVNQSVKMSAIPLTAESQPLEVHTTFNTDTLKSNPLKWIEGAKEELSRAVLERKEEMILDKILAGTNVAFGAGKTSRSSLGTGDKMLLQDLITIGSRLRKRNVPTFADGKYVCLISPDCANEIMTLTTASSWIDVAKYDSDGSRIKAGEIGMIGNLHVISYSFMKTFSSTVTVQPTIAFGADAFGVPELQDLRLNVSGLTPTPVTDPHGKLISVAVDLDFGSRILNEDNLQRFESYATIL